MEEQGMGWRPISNYDCHLSLQKSTGKEFFSVEISHGAFLSNLSSFTKVNQPLALSHVIDSSTTTI